MNVEPTPGNKGHDSVKDGSGNWNMQDGNRNGEWRPTPHSKQVTLVLEETERAFDATDMEINVKSHNLLHQVRVDMHTIGLIGNFAATILEFIGVVYQLELAELTSEVNELVISNRASAKDLTWEYVSRLQ